MELQPDITSFLNEVRPMLAHIVRPLVHEDQIDDILQDASLRIYLHWNSFDADIATRRTWAGVIARNLAISYRRVKRNRTVHLSKDEPIFQDDNEEVRTRLFVGEAEQEASLEDRERAALILYAIAHLRPQWQEIITLRISGMRYDDIAERLGLDMGTMKSRLWRARNQCRYTYAYVLHLSGMAEEEVSRSCGIPEFDLAAAYMRARRVIRDARRLRRNAAL